MYSFERSEKGMEFSMKKIPIGRDFFRDIIEGDFPVLNKNYKNLNEHRENKFTLLVSDGLTF